MSWRSARLIRLLPALLLALWLLAAGVRADATQGQCSSMVEQWFCKPLVGGSSPLAGSSPTIEEEVYQAVRNWFPEEEIEYVMCLAWYESEFKPYALGKAGERGILQISPYWNYVVLGEMGYTPDNLWNIDRNVQVAAEIRNRWGNFNAWSTRWKCGG